MVNKLNLREIWYDEVKEKIKNHLLWLRWSWKEEDRDFSNLDLTWLYSYQTKTVFEKANLTEANFQNSDIRNLTFSWTNTKWLDLRNANYQTDQFTQEQLSQAILTDEDYKSYLENKKITEENKKLKWKIKEKDEIINTIWEEQTDKLLKWFENLKKDFWFEEKRWLTIAIITFFLSLWFSTIIFIDSIFPELTKRFLYIFFWRFIFIILTILLAISDNNKQKKNTPFFKIPNWDSIKNTSLKTIFLWYRFIILTQLDYLWRIWENKKSLLDIKTPYYTLIPISIILFSFLYFSIYQYSRAKQLRIENQNKIALLHWFQALRAEPNDWIQKQSFYDNIANVVFTKVYQTKTSKDLPIDKVLDLVTMISKIQK